LERRRIMIAAARPSSIRCIAINIGAVGTLIDLINMLPMLITGAPYSPSRGACGT
jgi:hypothetical protein